MSSKTTDDAMFKVPRIADAPSMRKRHTTISFPVRQKSIDIEDEVERRPEWPKVEQDINNKKPRNSAES